MTTTTLRRAIGRRSGGTARNVREPSARQAHRLGVTGVNWKVSLMPLARHRTARGTQAIICEAIDFRHRALALA